MDERTERAIIVCVGAAQFVNILDFMIVMPLGPDFADGLGIPLSHLGYVGGSYTAAACVMGVLGALFLDKFDRKKALVVSLFGLALGTVAGAFARGLPSLMLARIVAGAFGGPATSLSYAIVADVIPASRRGKAMGAVMGAFSVASVLGVPAGLELARRGGWKLPFVAVGILGAIAAIYTQSSLPSLRGHIEAHRGKSPLAEILALLRRDIFVGLLITFLVMAAGFILLPNVASYILRNLGYPRERLGILYLAGGAVSFFTMRFVGRLVDRFGSAAVATAGSFSIMLVTYLGYVCSPPLIPVVAIFVGMMMSMALRNVAYNTLMSRVPAPEERARFGSLQSATQHLAASLASGASSQLLVELPNKTLDGIPRVATYSIALALAAVPVMWIVERGVLARAQKTSDLST